MTHRYWIIPLVALFLMASSCAVGATAWHVMLGKWSVRQPEVKNENIQPQKQPEAIIPDTELVGYAMSTPEKRDGWSPVILVSAEPINTVRNSATICVFSAWTQDVQAIQFGDKVTVRGVRQAELGTQTIIHCQLKHRQPR